MDEEEDDKAAELEALLEQFREPEEPPRKKSGVIWMVLAMVASVAGCWLAMRATEGTILSLKAVATPPTKPAKVKDRSAYYAAMENIDAEVDYRERCKKGMTVREVRWIVEDFVQAGLAEDAGGLPAEVQDAAEMLSRTSGWKEWNGADGGSLPPLAEKVADVLKSKGLQLASRQQRWYADALADGLRLDRAQRKDAYESGRKLVEDLGAKFPQPADAPELAHTGTGANAGSEEAEGASSPVEESELLVPALWLQDSRCAPWEKCQLRDDQAAVLNRTKPVPALPPSGELSEDGSSWYDPERVLVEALPREAATPGSANPEVAVPSPAATIHSAVGIFPFMADQDKGIAEDDLPGLLKTLHPAQLKMLLLIQPEMAGAAEEALAKRGE